MIRNYMLTVLTLVPLAVVYGLGMDSLKGTVVLFIDIMDTFLNKYEEDRKHEIGRVDSLLNGFILGARKALPESKPALSVEEILPNGAYLCLTKGYVTNMQTLTKTDNLQLREHSDGSLDITFYCHFEEFEVVFKTMYYESSTSKRTGDLTITFDKNKIALVLHVPHLATAIQNLVKVPCLLYIKSFEFTELSGTTVEVSNEELTNKKLQDDLKIDDDFLINMMKREVLRELYNTLPVNAVCRHTDLVKQAEKLEAMKGPKHFTDKFKDNCGEDLTPPVTQSDEDSTNTL